VGWRGTRLGQMSEPAPQDASPADAKSVIRRLVDEVMNDRRLDVMDEIYDPKLVRSARRWIEPFLESFADLEMRVVELVAEGERVVGRFSCSGTHVGTWLGHQPTGRRFVNVAEVYFFTVRDGRIVAAWGLEDLWARVNQLGLLGRGGDIGDAAADPAVVDATTVDPTAEPTA
jgi:predicted ester cyclase